jgi:hypothetical protein
MNLFYLNSCRIVSSDFFMMNHLPVALTVSAPFGPYKKIDGTSKKLYSVGVGGSVYV